MNSINSQTDHLADIADMSHFLEPTSISALTIVISSILITSIMLLLYYRLMHGFNGQLRHIKNQLKQNLITPREASHLLAKVLTQKDINQEQIKTLETLRFSTQKPTNQQIEAFISHVI